jgi:hypothetical protein
MNRKKCYRFLLFSCLAFYNAAFSHANPLFNGKWEYVEYKPGTGKPYSVFDISLSEGENGAVYGSYCFVTQFGNRDDCSADGELNINGHVLDSSRTASVTFYSFFGAKNGAAELSINTDNSLTWNIVKRPQGGDYYGPNRITLKKTSSVQDYLYDEPSDLKRSKAYVIKGDYVKLVKVSPDLRFWEVKFSAESGSIVDKWIDCQAIDFCAK